MGGKTQVGRRKGVKSHASIQSSHRTITRSTTNFLTKTPRALNAGAIGLPYTLRELVDKSFQIEQLCAPSLQH